MSEFVAGTSDEIQQCQAALARLWERNLRTPVGIEDDYFVMGGNSLLGTQLIAWIQEEFRCELSLLDIFETRTIATQAELLLSASAQAIPAAGQAQVEHRFFGEAHEALFGVFHRPANPASKTGVVLCYPIGLEYMQIHRTYVDLGRRLALAGLHVLRFDYFGSGDSAGEPNAGSLDRWTRDIRRAVQELRRTAGVERMYLVGARVAANLVLGVAKTENVAGLVLWEPVVNGAEYLQTLKRAHLNLLAGNAELDGYDERKPPNCFIELAGYPFSRQLFEEVHALDLFGTPAQSGTVAPAMLLSHSDKPALRQYAMTQGNGQTDLDYFTVDESEGIWLKEDRDNKGLIPAKAVHAIVGWISGRAT